MAGKDKRWISAGDREGGSTGRDRTREEKVNIGRNGKLRVLVLWEDKGRQG